MQYTTDDIVPQEAPHEIPDSKSAPEWPHDGAIEFRNVQMSYRAGLPNVLKGISISVEGGEKIGVVGRYVRIGCVEDRQLTRSLQNGCGEVVSDACAVQDRRAVWGIYFSGQVRATRRAVLDIGLLHCF